MQDNRCWVSVVVTLVVISLYSFAHGRSIQDQVTLRVSAQGQMTAFWSVSDASMRESLDGTVGYLRVQNNSNMPIESPIFYGEYFDAAGRFCFSLVFSDAKNASEPIAPGGSDELYSSTGGLFTASEPVELKVYLVQQRMSGKQSPSKWSVPMVAPITVGAGIPTKAGKLQVHTNLPEEGISDLVLAKLTVNQQGQVDQVDVLHAYDEDIRAWFPDFARQLTFYPSTVNGLPQENQKLISVRLLLSENHFRELYGPPRESPWVESYASSLKGSEISPVTQIIFQRPPRKVTLAGSIEWTSVPPAEPGLVQLMLFGSEWSSSAFQWVRDPSMPHHMRRELIEPNSQQ